MAELSIWASIASQPTPLMFGAIGGGLASALVTIRINAAAQRRARLALAVQLHELYVSPDFYARVRAPSYHVGLQWLRLSGPVGDAYRKAVLSGWVTAVDGEKLSRYVSEPPSDAKDVIKCHFHTPVGLSLLTEHQALTAELRFWTRLNTHLQLATVDRKVVRDLFSDEFQSHYDFLASLSFALRETKPEREPRWVKDIDQLAKFFGVKQGAEQGFAADAQFGF